MAERAFDPAALGAVSAGPTAVEIPAPEPPSPPSSNHAPVRWDPEARGGWFAGLLRAWAKGYVNARIRDDLDGLHAAGLAEARALVASRPVIFACNHSSWWDGLVMLAADQRLAVDARVLMDAERMREYPFFRAFGALPLDRSSSAAAYAGLQASAAFLRAPGRALWIFPQGRYRAPHRRPLDLKPGVVALARAAAAPVIPVSLTYSFREDERPAAFLCFGSALAPERPDLLAALELEIVAGLERIDAAPEDFAPLVPPRRRVDRGSPALAWIWRRLEADDD